MKKALFIILYLCYYQLFAQIEPKIVLDPISGNYNISYQGDSTIVNLIFEPSTKINPNINVKILDSNNLNRFQYSYIIQNGSTSIQRLYDFYLDVSSRIIEIKQPDNTWKSGFFSYMPIFNWYNSKDPNGLNNPLNGLAPNSIQGGFSFLSSGLPSISYAYFSGNSSTYLAFPDEPPSEIENLLSQIEKFPNNTVKRFTIIPKDPPNPFVPTQFVDTLLSYNSRSRTLSWINSQPTADKYNNYLTNAKTAFQQNRFVLARCYLQDILKNVDIDSNSTITSEAYALLHYNTEYLLSKLPAQTGLIVRLVNSNNDILTGGTLQYYDNSWKNVVDNLDGTFIVNTTFKTISLRMTYATGQQTISNVNVGNDIVTFKTTNTIVQLKDSQGNPIDVGTVQYYFNSWQTFGTTTNGVATKELLPVNYTFRITYATATLDKAQNLNTNNTVVFQTVPATVQLKNSQGNPLDVGTVQYYFNSWQSFGSTTNGIVTKELLPNSYTFRMTYATATKDKAQDVGTNPTVVFQTVPTTVQLKNSAGNLMDAGIVQYYFNSWQTFGSTTNGVVTKELLPNNYTFRMTHETITKDIAQNIATSNVVLFSTVLCTVRVKDSQNQPVNNAIVSYYFNTWKQIGLTSNGEITKELLPANLTFRILFGSTQKDKTQNISTNSIVEFGL